MLLTRAIPETLFFVDFFLRKRMSIIRAQKLSIVTMTSQL